MAENQREGEIAVPQETPVKRGRGRPRKGDTSRMMSQATPPANGAEHKVADCVVQTRPTPEPAFYIQLPMVKHITCMGKTSIYEKVKKGVFPSPIKIDTNTVWVQREVVDWCEKWLVEARKLVPSVPPPASS